MKEKINWDKYEVALLINTYFIFSKEKDVQIRKNIIETLSKKLRTRAINKGKKIDETFRDSHGITMRLMNIESILSSGRNARNYSKQDAIIIDLYKYDKPEFEILVNICESECEEVNYYSKIEKEFAKWLRNKAIQIEIDCLKSSKYLPNDVKNIFEYEEFTEILKVLGKVVEEKNISISQDVGYQDFVKAVNIYITFLKDQKNNELSKGEKINLKSNDSEQTLAQRFNISLDLMSDITLDDCGFSVRLKNRLVSWFNTRALKDILKKTSNDIEKIKGLGQNSIREFYNFLSNYQIKNQFDGNDITSKNNSISKIAVKYRDKLLDGSIENISEEYINDYEIEDFKKLLESYNTLGNKLVNDAILNSDYMTCIKESLLEFTNSFEKEKRYYQIISDELVKVPRYRLSKESYNYIMAFGKDVEILSEFYSKGKNIISNPNYVKDGKLDILLKFVRWCSFNINSEFIKYVNNNKDWINDRKKLIIEKRCNGHTLEEVGKDLDVTRERIRQIESKIADGFLSWVERKNIFDIISADYDGRKIFKKEHFVDYFKEYTDKVIYLLLSTKTASFYRYKKEDIFFVNLENGDYLIEKCIEDLPELFYESEKDTIISNYSTKYDIPKDILNNIIAIEFHNDGALVYSKTN